MRVIYISCALIALISAVTAKNINVTPLNVSLSNETNQTTNNKTTTAVPISTTSTTLPAVVTKSTNITSPTTVPQETTTPVATASASDHTVLKPTTTPTVVTKGTEATTTASQKPEISTLPTATKGMTTTPYPAVVLSQERHFDGLSFMGGIILTVCLVGIGVFSLKFYRTCSEGNYRTL